MTLYQRFTDGISTALDSFRLLWRNKIIMIYPLIPATLAIAIQLLFHPASSAQNPFIIVPTMDAALRTLVYYTPSSWLQAFILSLILGLLSNLFVTFFNAAIIRHATHVIRIKHAEVAQTLHACLAKWWLLLQWSLLLVALETLLNIPGFFHLTAPGSGATIMVNAILITISIVWSIATFLVLPFLILNEDITLINALRLSYAIIKRYLVEFFGGWLFLTFIGLVVSLILFIPHLLSDTHALFNIVFAPIDIIVGAFIAAAGGSFKAFFYDNYYEKPLEQLALAERELGF